MEPNDPEAFAFQMPTREQKPCADMRYPKYKKATNNRLRGIAYHTMQRFTDLLDVELNASEKTSEGFGLTVHHTRTSGKVYRYLGTATIEVARAGALRRLDTGATADLQFDQYAKRMVSRCLSERYLL